jgi:hypothetical protein
VHIFEFLAHFLRAPHIEIVEASLGGWLHLCGP